MTYRCVRDGRELAELAERVSRVPDVGFDTESSGPPITLLKKDKVKSANSLNVYRSTMTGFSVAFGPGDAAYVPVSHIMGHNADPEGWRKVLRAVNETRANVWVHNWGHDLHVTDRAGERVWPANPRCTMIMMFLLGRQGYALTKTGKEKPGFGLKACARSFLGMDMDSFADTTKGAQFCYLPPDGGDTVKYACDDAVAHLGLGRKFWPEIESARLARPMLEQEMPLVPVLLDMERRGMALDRGALESVYTYCMERLDVIRAEWAALVPGTSIQSPAQVSDSLFGEGVWPKPRGVKPGKSGRYPVNTDARDRVRPLLKEGSKGLRAMELYDEFQGINKNATTYTHNIIHLADQYPDRRVHTSFNQAVARTGRLSSSRPSMQNIPTRSELGKLVKAAFTPSPGNLLVAADFSQIELRYIAHLAGPGGLQDAYKRGDDVHQQTADALGLTRDDGKTVNFAVVYGRGAPALAAQLGVPRPRAQEILKGFWEARPEVTHLYKRITRKAYARGEVRTWSGRRRLVPYLLEAGRRDTRCESREQRRKRWSAERIARNTPIQGGAADIIKLAMLRLAEFPMVNQLHDEITLEVPEGEARDWARRLQSTMESAVELDVPLVAEAKIGRNWQECK